MPDLFAALARKRLNREALLDKTRLVLAEKEKEVTKAWAEKEKEVTKAWAEKATAEAEKATAQAEKATAEAELEATILRLQTKNMDDLRLANSVNLRGAIGKCRGQSCVDGDFSLSLPFYNHTYIFIESFQKSEVLPLLGLKPKTPLTFALWDRFLDARPAIRRRVERQTHWRKSKTAIELSHIYTTLSGRIHTSQSGDTAVLISQDILTKEECLGIGALLFDHVLIEFKPPELMEEFERNEREAKG